MSEHGVYSQHVDAMLPDDDGVDVLRDDDDEVMYDSCNDSNGEGQAEEAMPYDDVAWTEGIPARTIMDAMGLVEQCFSGDCLMAEFLTESEVKGEIAQNAEGIKSSYPIPVLLKDASRLLEEEPDSLVQSDSPLSTCILALSAVAVGHGAADAHEWRQTATMLHEHHALSLFIQAFSEMCVAILPIAKQVFSGQQDADTEEVHGPTRALRAVLNGLAGILLGTGLGLPHNADSREGPFEPCYPGLDDLLLQLIMLVRDAPAAPAILPGKKLVMLAHISLAALCGPVDITPSAWQEGNERSMRWVGDGAAEQYIASVLQSAAFSSRLEFVTADLLRACYYRYYKLAMERLLEERDTPSTDEQPPLSGTALAGGDTRPSLYSGIPLPIREALAVLAVHLARSQLKRQDAVVVSAEVLHAGVPDLRNATVAGVTSVAADDGADDGVPPIDVTVKDVRTEPSLLPMFPPRCDDHLQPAEGSYSAGTPSPAAWHATSQEQRTRREDVPIATRGELLFRILYRMLPGFVVGVFKLFLSSLPGEDTQRCTASLPEAEAATYGATSEAEVTRQRNITMKSVTALLLHVIKLISRDSAIQAEVVLQNMVESNGLLLLLKYLHQNSVLLLTGVEHVAEAGWDEAIEIPCPLPSNEGAHVPWGDVSAGAEGTLTNRCKSLVLLDGDVHTVVMCDARNLMACTTVLHLIRKLVRRHPSRLALMLFYKVLYTPAPPCSPSPPALPTHLTTDAHSAEAQAARGPPTDDVLRAQAA
eukprot:Rhum_TRINITY_DN5033_c0_g1::Rhum_TRINITY_DN5033_c0_g1_i1::g.16304::m.16304